VKNNRKGKEELLFIGRRGGKKNLFRQREERGKGKIEKRGFI